MVKMATVVLFIAWMAACSTVELAKGVPDAVNGILEQDYRVGVGDQLTISVWKNPDLSINVLVRPDGKISVPLVGDIVAANRTAEDLALEVTHSLEKFIRSPQVTVIVSNPVSSAYLQRVRITGAVNAPQSLTYQQGMTVLDVILQAGGVSVFGRANGALLYRHTDKGLKVYKVYLADILQKGQLETNFELAPSDILTVPERVF